MRWILPAQIAAQQVSSFSSSNFSQLLPIELEAKAGSFRRQLDIDQSPRCRSIGPCGAKLHQQGFALETHA
jgi:hypothetical protein